MGGMRLSRFSLSQRNIIFQSSDNAGKTTAGTTTNPKERGLTMNLARSFNNWRKYRQTVNELGRMTTRELHDLGISRSDILRVAREATGGR
jgi:uncharacterized protein YjiS (DUF1127 family)